MTDIPIPVLTLQIVILLTGIGLWIWSATRARQLLPWHGANRLTHWDIPLTDFLLFIFVVLLFIFVGSQAALHWNGRLLPDTPASELKQTVVSGYSFHLCSLAAWGVFSLIHPSIRAGQRLSWSRAITPGVRSLLFAIPAILLIGTVWTALLTAIDLPTETQPLIRIFREADNIGYLIALGILAVVIAPLNEEYLFRGGLFRFFSSRMPMPVAMVLSSMFFAILHLNWFSFVPLVTLGCFLCAVTRKTGSLKPAIVMHALFNLNSLTSILADVSG